MNIQDISFGDFTEEEFKLYFINNNNNNKSNDNLDKSVNGVVLPWQLYENSSEKEKYKQYNSELLLNKKSNKCYFNKFNSKKIDNNSNKDNNNCIKLNLIKQTLSASSSSTITSTTNSSLVSSKSSSMDNLAQQQQQQQQQQQHQFKDLNNAANSDSQRRNKKRKPPDYYKNYPVQILKSESEKQQQQQESDNQEINENKVEEDYKKTNIENTIERVTDNIKQTVFENNNNSTNIEKNFNDDDYEEDDDGTGSFESGVVSSNSITNSNPEENDLDSAATTTNISNMITTTVATTTATEAITSSSINSDSNQSSSKADKNNTIVEVDPIAISTLNLNTQSTTPENQTIATPVTTTSTTINVNTNTTTTTTPVTSTSTTTTATASAWSSGPKAWSSLFKSTKPDNDSNASISKKPLAVSVSQPAATSHLQKDEKLATTSLASGTTYSTLSSQNLASGTQTNVLKSLGEMFKQCELKHSAPALQPRGIKNKSNWCYVNATLQALLACPPFYNLIKSSYAKAKSSNVDYESIPCIYALGKFVHEFKTMIRDSNKTKSKDLVMGPTLEIDYFYETLGSLRSDFQFKGRQEDAQEFLSFLLNRLHDEMVKCLESQENKTASSQVNGTNAESNHEVNLTKSNDNDNLNGAVNGENDDEWKEVGKKNRAFVTRRTEFKQSPLSDIFCGQFRSALSQAGSREKESISLEPFFTLPLDIQDNSIRSVTEALEHFVKKEEILDFTNADTKQQTQAFRRINFEDLPPVLILYLKCFVYDKNGGAQKLLKRLDYAIDLEISRDLISQNQRQKLRDKKRSYKLFAVEYHYGDKATGGHYITDVYHPGIIGWVRFDDANAKVVTNIQVLKSEDKKLAPYLLYYRRADLI